MDNLVLTQTITNPYTNRSEDSDAYYDNKVHDHKNQSSKEMGYDWSKGNTWLKLTIDPWSSKNCNIQPSNKKSKTYVPRLQKQKDSENFKAIVTSINKIALSRVQEY